MFGQNEIGGKVLHYYYILRTFLAVNVTYIFFDNFNVFNRRTNLKELFQGGPIIFIKCSKRLKNTVRHLKSVVSFSKKIFTF